MKLSSINNLLELFFIQYEKQLDKNKILLSSLKEPKKKYSWHETCQSITKLSNELKKYVGKGDRCLIISENSIGSLLAYIFCIINRQSMLIP